MPRFRTKTKKAQIMSLEEAVKGFTRDGIMCAFSGFTGFNRNPFAFAWQMARQGVKNIHVIDRHGSSCTWLLNAVGAIKVYETDWMGWGEMAGKLDINLERRYKAGGDDSRGLLARRHGHEGPGRRDRRTLHSLQRAAGIGPLQSQVRRTRQGRNEGRQEPESPQEEVHPDGRALLGRGRHGPAPRHAGPSWPSSTSPSAATRARPAGAASAPSTRKSPLPPTGSSSWPRKWFPKRK